MSFSVFNFLFGLIAVIPVTIFIVYFRIIKIFTTKEAFGIWGVCFLFMSVLSLQTYGPRVALRTTPVVPMPEVHQIETGAELIPKEDSPHFMTE